MIVINKFKIREKKYWFIKIVKFEKKKKKMNIFINMVVRKLNFFLN